MSDLSALVVLRTAAGGELGRDQPITSENVAEALPAPGAVDLARQYFQAQGLDVTVAYGPSFSISASRERLEQLLGVELSDDVLAKGAEVQPDFLPPELAAVVQAVVFTPPPDFGPTDFR